MMTRGNDRGSQNRGRGHRGHRGHRGGSMFRSSNRGRGKSSPPEDFSVLDYPVQIWPQYDNYDDLYQRGSLSSPNHGGRGRGYRGQNRGQRGQRGTTPVSGRSTPRGRDRGRRHAGIGSPSQQMKLQTQPRLGPDAPLSQLIYETRPLLRPIVFVRSTETPFLFQYEEELLKPVVEDVETEENAVPTADRVAQVFSGMTIADTDSNSEQLDEIDFTDMQKLLEITAKPVKMLDQVADEHFTGSRVPTSDAAIMEVVELPTNAPCTNELSKNSVTKEGGIGHPPTLATRTSDDVVYLMDMLGPLDAEMVPQRDRAGIGNDSSSSAANTPPLSQEEEMGYEDTLPSVGPEIVDLGADLTPTPAHTTISEPNLNNQILSPIKPREDGDATAPPIALSTDAQRDQNIISMDQTPEYPDTKNFYIDITPAPNATTQQALISHSLEPPDDEEEVIVYVPPHPRSGRATPAAVEPHSTLRMTSVLTGLSTINETPRLPETDNRPVDEEVATPAATPASLFTQARKARQFVSPLLLASPSTHHKAKLRVRRHEARLAKKRKDTRPMFSLAAARQETEGRSLEERDPRWEERRRGDSDIDWGDEDETQVTQEGAASDAEGMDVDPDLLDERSKKALGLFANAVLGQEQSNFITMDDIADANKLREEDEASQGSSDDDELEEEEEGATLEDYDTDGDEESEEDQELEKALEEEEEKMLAEEDNVYEINDTDEDEIDDSSDDGLSPGSSFQARLDRLRKLSRKSRGKMQDISLEEADFDYNFMWEDHADDLLKFEELLDENEDILFSHDRRQKNRLFKAISDGNYDDLSEFTVARRRKDKAKGIPDSLQEQWEKDRAKKAEYKAARQMAKLEAAADPFSKKKGGKKGRKAMLAATRANPMITTIGPNRIIDMSTLVQQIRQFLSRLGGPQTMSLPPTSKSSRKLVHEMASAFYLKSKSKGPEGARYITLTKTRMSGCGWDVDEQKVNQLVRRGRLAFDDDTWNNENENRKGKGKLGGGGGPRQQEGEEVGKAAPKIDSSNIGFKMLEAMGWSEGNRIGTTGGLEQPLTAIIKRSKLGLGATKA